MFIFFHKTFTHCIARLESDSRCYVVFGCFRFQKLSVPLPPPVTAEYLTKQKLVIGIPIQVSQRQSWETLLALSCQSLWASSTESLLDLSWESLLALME